jgi:hypothetical protein
MVAEDFAGIMCSEYRAVSLSALDPHTFGPFLDAARKIIGSLQEQPAYESSF